MKTHPPAVVPAVVIIGLHEFESLSGVPDVAFLIVKVSHTIELTPVLIINKQFRALSPRAGVEAAVEIRETEAYYVETYDDVNVPEAVAVNIHL